MIWRSYNLVIAAFLVAIGMLCVSAATSGNYLAAAYGLAEVFGGYLAVVNVLVARGGDWSLRGLTVSVCYLVGLFVLPEPSATPVWLIASECVIVGALFYTRWVAWSTFTCGVPCWVGLLDRGPYAYVRHPQAVVAIAARWVFVAGNVSTWNLATALLFTAAMMLSVWCEESYLAARLEWHEYAGRVRWRFVPGIV